MTGQGVPFDEGMFDMTENLESRVKDLLGKFDFGLVPEFDLRRTGFVYYEAAHRLVDVFGLSRRAGLAKALALGLPVQPVAVFGDPYGARITSLPPVAPACHRPVGAEESRASLQAWLNRNTANVPSEGTKEVRTVSSTGAAKGVKPARMSLIPSYPLHLVAEHYAAGARKYSSHNWRAGYEFSKSLDAMLRHAYQFVDGEDNDPETGTSHLCAVVFHAFTLLQGLRDWPQFDDRYKREVAA